MLLGECLTVTLSSSDSLAPDGGESPSSGEEDPGEGLVSGHTSIVPEPQPIPGAENPTDQSALPSTGVGTACKWQTCDFRGHHTMVSQRMPWQA